MRGGDVDNPPPLSRLHRRQCCGGRVECRGKVDRNDPVPLLDGELVNRRDMLDTGIVDENVDAAEFFYRDLDKPAAWSGFDMSAGM